MSHNPLEDAIIAQETQTAQVGALSVIDQWITALYNDYAHRALQCPQPLQRSDYASLARITRYRPRLVRRLARRAALRYDNALRFNPDAVTVARVFCEARQTYYSTYDNR